MDHKQAKVVVGLVRAAVVALLSLHCSVSGRGDLRPASASPRPPVSAFPHLPVSASPRLRVSASANSVSPSDAEYLWYEAENMRGITATATNEPLSNPSWMHLPASKAPGWGINGPGVSAEWTQGGESEWNSVNASADETRGTISQDIEVPRPGDYKVWVRYADWAEKT